MRLERLLVPHDFSPHADRALRFAASLAGPTGELLVLHAVMPIVPTADFGPGSAFQIPIEDLVAGAREGLERRVARLVGKRGPRAVVQVVVGDPYGRIIDNVRGRDAVVMSTMGRTGLPHLVIGSVAEKVVRHSPIPVLTLRPAVARRATRTRARRVSRRG